MFIFYLVNSTMGTDVGQKTENLYPNTGEIIFDDRRKIESFLSDKGVLFDYKAINFLLNRMIYNVQPNRAPDDTYTHPFDETGIKSLDLILNSDYVNHIVNEQGTDEIKGIFERFRILAKGVVIQYNAAKNNEKARNILSNHKDAMINVLLGN